jgi:hypothetical protein
VTDWRLRRKAFAVTELGAENDQFVPEISG